MTGGLTTLFLCGDVMPGRGVDQILPYPGDPELREEYLDDARTYVRLAERANGPIPHPVSFSWPWGDGSPYLTGVPPIRLLRPARPDPAGRPHGALAAAPFLATFRDRLRRARSLPPGGAAEDRGPVRRVAVPASVSFIRRLRFPQADPLPGF